MPNLSEKNKYIKFQFWLQLTLTLIINPFVIFYDAFMQLDHQNQQF